MTHPASPSTGTDWQKDAECAGYDTALFFGASDILPVSGAEKRLAKSICFMCPVRTQCLTFAMETQERWGIWGGLTAPERERLRRKRG